MKINGQRELSGRGANILQKFSVVIIVLCIESVGVKAPLIFL